jgi:CRP-like cAMP-binding protein
MQADEPSGLRDAVAARPLSELLECSPEARALLNGSATTLNLDVGESVFRQGEPCAGMYVVVSGQFVRRTERLNSRLTLGTVRPGDLVELAAALGDGVHTFTLTAQTPGSLLMLPLDSLRSAFQRHPPLRMRLLEELGREVCRAYLACIQHPPVSRRRRNGRASA